MAQERRELPIDDDTRLDLLVDGELNEPDRRELLAGLDDEPGGWRRCALAFLEAQSWRHEMPALMHEPRVAVEKEKPATLLKMLSSPGARKFVSRMALAASFLVAFSVGLIMRGAWNPPVGDMGTGNRVAVEERDRGGDKLAPSDTLLAGNDTDVLDGRHDEDADVLQPFNSPPETHTVMHGGGQIPSQVVQALERMGYKVEQSREFWTIDSGEGSRGFVPVDKTDIRYVGDWYQ